MPRFYCPQPLTSGATIDLPEAVAHHARVVRLQPGVALTLFNGEGGEYAASLESINKKHATARIGAFLAREAELPYAVTLAQALPEGGKMDWIVEKAVELGVLAIVPVAAQRCVTRLSGERLDKRMAHWHGVIVAAAEQSGRNRLSMLQPLQALSQLATSENGGCIILLSPRSERTVAQWARETAPRAVTLVIGPEGGLTPEEEQALLVAGAQSLGLGPRILRTETAGLAVLATIAAHWSDR